MKRVLLISVIFAISGTDPEVTGSVIYGKGTNISEIMWMAWLQGSGKKWNRLPPTHDNDNWRWRDPGPDAAVGRRFLKKFLAAVRTALLRDNSNAITKDSLQNEETDKIYGEKPKLISIGKLLEPKKITVDDETSLKSDLSEKYSSPAKGEGKNMLRSQTRLVQQAHREQRKLERQIKQQAKEVSLQIAREKARSTLIQRQHEDRVKEVIEFINHNKLSTQYLHEEVRRIKKTGRPKDILRQMIDYLELPGNQRLKGLVIKCFKKRRLIDLREKGFWSGRIPNKLILDIINDPLNDGV